jgi:hypothetical protein
VRPKLVEEKEEWLFDPVNTSTTLKLLNGKMVKRVGYKGGAGTSMCSKLLPKSGVSMIKMRLGNYVRSDKVAIGITRDLQSLNVQLGDGDEDWGY